MTTKQKLAFIAEQYPESLTADGFDDAIIGFDASGGNVIYDYNKCLKIWMERDNMNYKEEIRIRRECVLSITIQIKIGEIVRCIAVIIRK